MIDIRFDAVGKRYRIAPAAARARLARWFRRPGEDFWAVRDVTFEVARGETLGIVGHNGAGKSTLLKLLSRITAPTTGEIAVTGRLAALIEVGSGFHPELTGRENIFLSGSILGMRRREIALKLDRIIDFAGVGAFIDTPVKRYSSGMYVRLGFAIAAHLEPDVLLVDEVIAVGDAAFQIQCHERLAELRRDGTTMLFISHDLGSIEALCDRVILMERGRLVAGGAPHAIVEEYQRMATMGAIAAPGDAPALSASRPARIVDVRIVDERGGEVAGVSTGHPMKCRVEYEAEEDVDDAVVEAFFYSRDGRTLHCQFTTALTGGRLALERGRGAVEFSALETGLQPGVYAVGAAIRRRQSAESIDWFYGRTLLYVQPGRLVRGFLYTPHSWQAVRPRPADVPAAAGGDAGHRRRPHI